jgi:hypothetical protein
MPSHIGKVAYLKNYMTSYQGAIRVPERVHLSDSQGAGLRCGLDRAGRLGQPFCRGGDGASQGAGDSI